MPLFGEIYISLRGLMASQIPQRFGESDGFPMRNLNSKWVYRIARSPLVIRVLVPLHSGVGQNYNQEQLKVLF